ncbi:MAG: NAD-dependent epimerase/dehydratase family protein [Bacteroidales bacterium]
MREIDSSKPVAVTGGTGYIASWLVSYLLDRGLKVKVSVRKLGDTARYEHLSKLAVGKKGKIEFHEGDLLKPGSFDELVKDCELVFHTASPFKIAEVSDFKSEVIKPALDGTRNLLASVNKAGTVKRVILTASVASIYGDAADILLRPGRIFRNTDWNSTSSEIHQPYSYSKTIAEREAWRIAGSQDKWDLITIHPGFVMGPSLTGRKDSTSIDFMISYMKGRFRFGTPDLWFGVVDVRDVAMAHVQAAFNPSAAGRYIAVGNSYSLTAISTVFKSVTNGKYHVSPRKLPSLIFYVAGPLMGYTVKFVKKNIGIELAFDNSAAMKDLGLKFRPIDETIRDHVRQLEGLS